MPFNIIKGHFVFWNMTGYKKVFEDILKDFKEYQKHKKQDIQIEATQKNKIKHWPISEKDFKYVQNMLKNKQFQHQQYIID